MRSGPSSPRRKRTATGPTRPTTARGDHWDHVAFDPDHRLVVCVVPGKRTAENTGALVRDFHRRTSGRLMDLITTDEYAPYQGAILEAYGRVVTPPRTGKRGRPRKAYKVPPAGLTYATVHKTRSEGRVVKVEQRVIFETAQAVVAALARSASSRAVNTSFVERQNGTDRNRNARKTRKGYGFSKDWSVHQAITFFTMYSYNFLLAGPDTASQVGSGYLAESDAGDGGGPGRSRLVALGVVDATCCPSEVGHKAIADS